MTRPTSDGILLGRRVGSKENLCATLGGRCPPYVNCRVDDPTYIFRAVFGGQCPPYVSGRRRVRVYDPVAIGRFGSVIQSLQEPAYKRAWPSPACATASKLCAADTPDPQ